jgi:hypothetical protein
VREVATGPRCRKGDRRLRVRKALVEGVDEVLRLEPEIDRVRPQKAARVGRRGKTIEAVAL